MKYRKGRDKTLDTLYEQPGLSKLLEIPSDKRQHYISIALRLPQDIREQLSREAIDWTNGWDEQIYYVQKTDSIHLTFVDIGPINDFKKSLSDVVAGIEKYLLTIEKNNLCFILTEPKIGSSGINCEIKVESPQMDTLVKQLHGVVGVAKRKSLEERSISLVRYLIPNSSFKPLIEKRLSKIEKVNAIYNQEVNVKELHLVRLDKVAEYFQILHTFTFK